MVYLSVRVIQKVKRFHLKSENNSQRKKNRKSHFFLESQQYNYHHELEEEYREVFFPFNSVFKSDQ